jgi:hypothetical protein
MKIAYWRGFPAISGLEGAPMLDFAPIIAG